MSEESGAGVRVRSRRRSRASLVPAPSRGYGPVLRRGAAVVVATATLMASSPVDGAGITAQEPSPATFQAFSHPAGRPASPTSASSTSASSTSAAPPPTAPGTNASPASSATAAASGLAAGGIPSVAKAAYDSAAAAAPAGCGIDWSLVAAIGRVESDHGRFAGAVLQTDGRSAPRIIGIQLNGNGTAVIRDTDGGRLDGDPAYDRAVGPMQFIPSTWARYASDGDGDSSSDPFDIHDAARATARYLCAAGGDLTAVAGQRRAVLAYNHSDAYVATVLTLAARYAGTPPPTVPTDAVPPPSEPPANPGPPPAVQPAASPQPPAAPSSASPSTSPSVTTPPTVTASPPTTTTPPSTTPPSTTPPVTTPPTTTPPVTTPPITTPPSTTPPPTTPPVTTPPTTTPPVTTPPVTTPPTPTTPPTTTSPTTTTPPVTTPGCTTPAVAALGTVDIRDGSADPVARAAVGARVLEAGGTVGVVTTTQDATSAVLYPDGPSAAATALADALGVTGGAEVGDVERITVVIGAADAARLVCAP